MMFYYLETIIICVFTLIFGSIVNNNVSALNEDSNTVTEEILAEDEDYASQSTDSHTTAHQQLSNVQIPYSRLPIFLTSLAQTEQFIYQSLLEYEKQLEERLEILRRLRTDYENSVLVAMQQIVDPELMDDWTKASVISSHPVLAYRMIRRFAKDLRAFTEHLWQSLENSLWESLESYRGNFAWPSQDELNKMAKSLIRIQDVHDFDMIHFTDGAIQDHSLKVGLTAKQCLEISETALEIGDINSATDWFQAAHYKGVRVVDAIDHSVTMNELTQAWEKTYQAFQSIWPMQIFTTHDVFKEAKELLRNDFNNEKGNLTKEHAPVNFKALCRGDKLLTDHQILLSHTCYLEISTHPYYILNPLKIETYNWQPLVYKVHDFIGPKTIVDLSHTVVPSMVSLVESGQAELQGENPEKTFTYSFISDHDTNSLSVLARKIDLLPGLNLFQLNAVSSNLYQVSTFAVGGHYEPCNECFKEMVSDFLDGGNAGRLISTVQIVLHEPQKGGELAFPLLGVSVTPSIGSVIVHNEINGIGNSELTMHGGCPVLLGEKWIATKQIYERF